MNASYLNLFILFLYPPPHPHPRYWAHEKDRNGKNTKKQQKCLLPSAGENIDWGRLADLPGFGTLGCLLVGIRIAATHYTVRKNCKNMQQKKDVELS